MAWTCQPVWHADSENEFTHKKPEPSRSARLSRLVSVRLKPRPQTIHSNTQRKGPFNAIIRLTGVTVGFLEDVTSMCQLERSKVTSVTVTPAWAWAWSLPGREITCSIHDSALNFPQPESKHRRFESTPQSVRLVRLISLSVELTCGDTVLTSFRKTFLESNSESELTGFRTIWPHWSILCRFKSLRFNFDWRRGRK
jgi:hypothetical protein